MHKIARVEEYVLDADRGIEGFGPEREGQSLQVTVGCYICGKLF